MTNVVITLVLLFAGGVDGGRAMDTGLKFSKMEKCEQAGEKIQQAGKFFNSGYGARSLVAVCIEQ